MNADDAPTLAELERRHVARRCCVELTIPLLAEPAALSMVRHRIRAYFALWDLLDLADTAELCVSELITNALVHVGAGTPITLHASMAGPYPRLSLTDSDPGSLPTPLNATDDAESGRGLALLAALSHDWGVIQDPTCKTIWCELSGGTRAPGPWSRGTAEPRRDEQTPSWGWLPQPGS